MKKRNITLWGLMFLGCLFGAQTFAQIVNHPSAGNAGTFTINPPGTGSFQYFDPGGSGANYATQIFNSTVTFAPSAPANKVRVTFSSFQTEAGFDFLSVYDGPSTASPLIASAAGAAPPTNQPGGIVQATPGNATGQLTFNFFSDFSVTAPGWAATVQELVAACAMTAPANLTVNTGAGDTDCAADAVSALPGLSPSGCISGSTLRYRINAGAPVVVAQPLPANITLNALPKGVNVVQWEIVDANGNVTAQVSHTITVIDNTLPTITCPGNINVNLGPGECCQFVSWNVVGTDNCPGVGPNTVLNQDVPFTNYWSGYFTDMVNLNPNFGMNISNVNVQASLAGGAAGNYNLRVYMRLGGSAGFEGNIGAWTLAGQITANVTAGFPTQLLFNVPTTFTIPAGQTAGVAVVANNGANTLVRVVAQSTFANSQTQDANLRLNQAPGRWMNGNFGGVIFAGENPKPQMRVTYNLLIPIAPVLVSGPASGSELCKEGSPYTSVYRVTDAAGNSATCSFNITVNEYANPVTTLTCNDFVYVSLDESCTTELNADQILEGGPYGCYDDYIVQLDKTPPYGNGPWVPGILGPSDVGKTYAVQVIDPETGNKCWGNLKVEDKLPPVLDCPPAILPCNFDPTPLPIDLCQDVPGSNTVLEQNVAFTNYWTGYMNNVQNISTSPIDVKAVKVQASLAGNGAGTYNLKAYMRLGGFQGFAGSNAGWTLVGDVNVNITAGFPTVLLYDIPFTTAFNIPAGQTAGFYIVANNGVGTGTRVVATIANTATQDSKLRIVNNPGNWVNGLFGGVAFPGENPKPQIAFTYSATLKACVPLPNNLTSNQVTQSGNSWIVFAGGGNPVLENCSDVTLTYIDSEVPQDCPTGLTKIINRKWTAKDASGNTSTCIQVINVLRPTLGDVVFPPNYDNVDEDALECGISYPTPDYIESQGLQGYPYVFGQPDGCTIGWTHNDVVIDVCDGTYKILRKWSIIDWCSGEDVEVNQVIKVLDDEGPAISCPANLTVSTDPFSCCAVVNLPDVIVEDACSRINNLSGMIIGIDPFTLDTIGMFPIGGNLTSFPGNNLWDLDTLGAFGLTPCLPVGTHTVVYQAEDDCGNTSTCTFRLTVRDYVPPVAACTEFTVVSIGVDDPYDCYGPAGFLDVPPALDACQGAGVTWVKAKTFDQGSYDNCNNVKFTVQRMTPYSDCINGLNAINGFLPCDDQFPDFPSEFQRAVEEQDSIKFYCCEVGTTQMVILRVYQLDAFGNLAIGPDGTPISNSCMIEVEVQDKIKPVCVSPANVTVSCEAFDPSLWAYGKPAVYDNCCLDTSKVYQGQCGLQHSVNYNLFDTVCNRGTITRTFRVFDCHGQSAQCTQRIIVNYEQDYFIKFPNDVVVTTCDGTGNYGEPAFFGDQDCELLGVSFEDEVFTVVPDACLKIERTWTIINWCTYNPNGTCIVVPNPNPNATINHPSNLPGPIVSACGTPQPWNPTVVSIAPGQPQTNFCTYYDANANCYKYKQIIKIVDQQDPTVTNCPASPVTYCDYTTNDPLLWNQMYWWDPVTGQHDLCEGDAPLTITATDACSGANINITYLLFLDLDGDGSMETVINSNNAPAPGTVNYGNLGNPNYSGGTVRVFDGRPVLPNDIYRWANHQSVSGTSRTAAVQWKTFAQMPTPANQFGTAGIPPQLPYGTHKIKWTITDGCGNETFCEYQFIVKDCKAPTVVCFKGLSVNIMPGGMVTMWATDFLQYSEDNCTPTSQIKYAIRKAGQGTGFPVDGNNDPITSVTFDCSELGEQPVELWAQDLAGNADFCATFIDVQDNNGNCTNDKVNVAGALKTESGDGVEDANVNLQTGANSLFDMTDNQGAFAFNNAVPTGDDYTVTPTKDDNPLNGVSTYDLVLISKHILGLEPLGSPYKMIAADANKSNSITTFDIVEIRKLILGIYTELPANTSWRFVDKGFAFPNPANPFQTQFPENISVAGVTAHQLGDDFTAVKVGDVNGTAIANSALTTDDRTAGTLLFDVEDRQVKAGETFTVTFKSAEAVQGFQFTLNLSGVEVASIEETDRVTKSNFGVFADALTTSIDGAGEFAVTFRAQKSGKLSEMLGVSSRITRAEAYSQSNNRLEVALRFNGQGASVISGVGFELYQNQPNPFVNKTVIGFHLPEASEATLTVYDETGRMLFVQKGQFAKGDNAISVDRALLNTTGVMYYKVETATDSATKKMIQTK